MKKMVQILFFLWGAGLFLPAQGTEAFDYHRQESPAISWNGSYLYDARLLSLGGISFFTSAPFRATLNPAIVPEGAKKHLGITYNASRHQAFQYWGLNQGAIYSQENQIDSASQFSGAAALISVNNLSISAGWYVSNLLQYPSFDHLLQYNRYSGDFSGKENTLFTALAWQASRQISVGAKLTHVSGKRSLKTTLEDADYFFDDTSQTWQKYDLFIEQEEVHQRTHWSLTLGTTISLTSIWTMGIATHLPFTGKTDREVIRRFRNPRAFIDFASPQQGQDDIYNPKRVLIGNLFTLPLKPSKNSKNILRLGIEIQYSFWREYKLIFFGEEIPRDMRNTNGLALGLEYGSLSPRRELFIRLGFRLDPQPIKKPATTLNVISGGIGLKIKRIRTDLGLAYITTTTDSPAQNHLIFNAGIGISL